MCTVRLTHGGAGVGNNRQMMFFFIIFLDARRL